MAEQKLTGADALVSTLALEHGDRQCPELACINRGDPAGHLADQPGHIQEPVQQWRQVAEKEDLLLQVDVNPPEKNLVHALVFLIGTDRRVGGDQLDIDSLAGHRTGQGIVMQATATVHAGSTRCQVGDFLGQRCHERSPDQGLCGCQTCRR